ncbi:hypothetical protein ACFOR8_24720, partial [Streptomyces xanthochromogenes]
MWHPEERAPVAPRGPAPARREPPPGTHRPPGPGRGGAAHETGAAPQGPAVTAAAVFLPAGLPREGRVAFWDPEQGPAPQGPPGAETTELTVVRRHGAGARSRKVAALVLPVTEALPALVRARHHPAAHPAAACWGAAALHALHLVARGRLLPGLTSTDHDAWRAGPLDADDIAQLRAIAAAMPHEAYGVPVPGRGALQLPDPQALVRAFLDAVADSLP